MAPKSAAAKTLQSGSAYKPEGSAPSKGSGDIVVSQTGGNRVKELITRTVQETRAQSEVIVHAPFYRGLEVAIAGNEIPLSVTVVIISAVVPMFGIDHYWVTPGALAIYFILVCSWGFLQVVRVKTLSDAQKKASKGLTDKGVLFVACDQLLTTYAEQKVEASCEKVMEGRELVRQLNHLNKLAAELGARTSETITSKDVKNCALVLDQLHSSKLTTDDIKDKLLEKGTEKAVGFDLPKMVLTMTSALPMQVSSTLRSTLARPRETFSLVNLFSISRPRPKRPKSSWWHWWAQRLSSGQTKIIRFLNWKSMPARRRPN